MNNMNNMKKLFVIKGFLITQMNHMIYCTVAVTTLAMTGYGQMKAWQYILLGALPFIFFIFRCTSDKPLHFAGLHIAAATIAGFLLIFHARGEAIPTLIYIVYITGYLIISLVLRVKNETRMEQPAHPVLAMVILILMMAIRQLEQTGQQYYYYTAALLIYAGLYFVCYYLEQFGQFVKINENITGHIPKREMFKTGIKLVGIFAVSGMVILFIVSRINTLPGALASLRNLMRIASQLIVEAMRLILNVFFRIIEFFTEILAGEEAAAPPEAGSGEPGQTMEDILSQYPISENTGSEVVLWILFAVFAGLITAAAVSGLIKLLKFIRMRFRQRLAVQSQEEDSVVDVHEKVELERSKTRSRGVFAYLSARERIRRIYRKRVGEGISEIKTSYTAQECGRALNAPVLAGMYDKARYSEEKCTPEDVRAAKLRQS